MHPWDGRRATPGVYVDTKHGLAHHQDEQCRWQGNGPVADSLAISFRNVRQLPAGPGPADTQTTARIYPM